MRPNVCDTNSPSCRLPYRRFPGRRGNVLPLVVVLLVFIIGMVAFAIDTGYIAVTRTQLQRTADAGAQAGVQRLALIPNQTVPESAVAAEVRLFVDLNDTLTVRNEDIRLLRYDPSKPPGQRLLTTWSRMYPPNAVEVTVRRDRHANGPLNLFFAPVLGQDTAEIRARTVACLLPVKAVRPGVPMIPFAMHKDFYLASTGQAVIGPDGSPILTTDNYHIRPDLSVVSGSDGVKEVSLFSSTKTNPGNFGSIDIGSLSNGTIELERQILYGPTLADFQNPAFKDKVNPDGALYAPFTAMGDPGLSASVKDAFLQIVGKPRIIPLYDAVTGTGNNTQYHIIGFAAVVITAVDMGGSPKRISVQPTGLLTSGVVPDALDGGTSFGVYAPLRIVIP